MTALVCVDVDECEWMWMCVSVDVDVCECGLREGNSSTKMRASLHNCEFLFFLLLLLPAGRAQSSRSAGPKITLRFPHLYLCASALITYAIITSRTLLLCDLT